MNNENGIKLFEDKSVRTIWNDEQEKWYFSVVDIVSILTDNDYQAGRKYWKTLKMRLNKEGSELVTKCYQLKMKGTNPTGFEESKNTVIQGGTIAKMAKEQIEKASSKKIVSSKNAKELRNEKSKQLLN